MSILTALPVNNFNASPFSFREKGYSMLRPARMSEVHVQSIRLGDPNLKYSLLFRNLGAFLKAYDLGESIIADGPSAQTKILQWSIPPFDMPYLFLSGVGEGSKELMEKHGMRPFESEKGVYVGKPPVSALPELAPYTDPEGKFSPPGNVRPAGYNASSLLWKCLVISAALSDIATNSEGAVMVADITGLGVGKYKEGMEDFDGDFFDTDGGDGKRVLKVQGAEKKTVYQIDTSVKLVAPEWSGEIDFLARGLLNTTDVALLNGYGGSHAFVFPFFDGLTYTDIHYVPTKFLQLFSNMIFSDIERFAGVLPSIRDGLTEAARSRAGQAMAHALFCAELAISSESCFMLLHDGSGKYTGTLIMGANLRMIVGRTLLEPLTGTDLTKELRKLSTHATGLDMLFRLLDQIPLKTTGVPLAVVRDQNITARALAHHFKLRKVEILGGEDALAKDLLKQFKEGVSLLQFSQQFHRSSDVDAVIEFMKHLRLGTEDPLAPFYLDGSLHFASDPVAWGLAVFGPEAPSIFRGTKRFDVPKEGVEDPNLALNETGKRSRVPFIPIYKGSYEQAISEWRGALSNSCFKVVKGKNEKQFCLAKADVAKASGKDFDKFYAEMKATMTKWSLDMERSAEEKKRKAADEGKRDKKGKVVRASQKEVDDFFAEL